MLDSHCCSSGTHSYLGTHPASPRPHARDAAMSAMDTSPSQTPPHRHAYRAADAVLRSHTPTSQFGKSALVRQCLDGTAFAPPAKSKRAQGRRGGVIEVLRGVLEAWGHTKMWPLRESFLL